MWFNPPPFPPLLKKQSNITDIDTCFKMKYYRKNATHARGIMPFGWPFIGKNSYNKGILFCLLFSKIIIPKYYETPWEIVLKTLHQWNMFISFIFHDIFCLFYREHILISWSKIRFYISNLYLACKWTKGTKPTTK